MAFPLLRCAGARSARLKSLIPSQHVRCFMGLGEIAGVVANPAETLRQLNESKEMLRQAKEQHELSQEAKKIPRKYTFSKLPGFHGRNAEQTLLRKTLANDPRMTVIFGATSVGKTALLREVLATDDFYVIKFDLRISGFADLRTLYIALCEQFERFFEEMHDEEMDKNKLTFKHLILELHEREKPDNGGHEVTVADLASLMESLQSCLLKYWVYDPTSPKKDENEQPAEQDEPAERKAKVDDDKTSTNNSEAKPSFVKKPIVFLLDEAHKLPALIDDQLSLKVFLDTLLVLTKQDRLCHVLFSTSDSFFQHFLRQMNVGHHAQLMTIGDCTKEEALLYFTDQMIPAVPQRLASKLNFEQIYEAFGGKLSHINDYVTAWANSGGTITPTTSSIFIQAYTLLQFHLTHGIETYSPLSTATAGTKTDDDGQQFSGEELLYVMKKMVERPFSLPYFKLCREIGAAKVDNMIKARILELRWSRSVTDEDEHMSSYGGPEVWSRDGIERPVVLPMTTVIRRAMEVILKEEEQVD